ncbi:glutamate receptor ionotropic, kainate 1-like [Corticium candelabrum]|uniref:glutamate receptor ionotropic, kainate 1-like n=1 Tax=Corticium candelabrum TaxID=121492 RepID=UPI002E25852B|nr:glutamate receptor ionotropic, kainate 1-like [Corticium candelabrum]
MRGLLCTLIVGLALCLQTLTQTCNRPIDLVLAVRREGKSQSLIESVQESVSATNKRLEQELHSNISKLNLTVREMREGADNVTIDMMSIQLLDKPDILLTTESFYNYKLMVGIAHSGGFPVWSVQDMFQWGPSNEIPSEYDDIAVVPKLSATMGVSDAKGQIIFDLVEGLALKRVLEIKTESNESTALAAFHNILRALRKEEIQIRQLEVENESSILQRNLRLALSNNTRAARLPEVSDLLAFKPEVIVIECFLGLALNNLLKSMAEPINEDYQMITDTTIVIFLHHPYSVLEWDDKQGLLNTISNVFLLEQLPTGSLPHNGNDINEALAYDSITAIRETIISLGDYNPCDRVESSVRGSVNFSYSNQGKRLATLARQVCLHENITRSGRIRFTLATDVCKHYSLEQPPVEYNITSAANMSVFAHWSSKLKPSLQVQDIVRANNLNQTGIKLTNIKDIGVIIALSTPFAYRDDKTGDLAGVAIDLLDHIAKMGNFSYRTNVEVWDNEDNGTWDKLAKDVGNGKLRCGYLKCHIAVGAITVTPDRANTANFTRSFFTSGLRILAPVRNNNENPSIWNFFKPFHWTVWFTTAGMILVSSLIATRLDLAQGIREGMWLSVSLIYAMQENSLVRMRNPFGRIYILVFSFVLLVLVSSYTANMVSFLTVRNTKDDVTDINGLRRVRVAARSWASDWNALQDAGITTLFSVPNGTTGVDAIIRSTDTVSDSSNANMTTPVADVYVADSAHLELLKSQTCHVKVTSSREIFKQQYAFVMMNKYEYSDSINKLITEAIADGVVQDSYNNHTHKKSVHCKDEGSASLSDDALSLTISNLGGVFLIAAAVGVLCLACKLLASFFRRREQTLKITADDPQKVPIPLYEFERTETL